MTPWNSKSATTRFATHQQGSVAKSPVADGIKWTTWEGAPKSEFAGYDPDHHLLYVTDTAGAVTIAAEDPAQYRVAGLGDPYRSLLRGLPPYRVLDGQPDPRAKAASAE